MSLPPETLTLRARDGARISTQAQGGQLLQWQPAGSDASALFLSPLIHPGTPRRGGVPLVFPQFAMQGPLPRHGLVRTRDWQLLQRCEQEMAMAVYRFESDAQTLATWPHAFALEFTVLAQGSSLELELAVENSGEQSFEFQAALHSYLRVSDVAQCVVEGLQDRRYFDSLTGMQGVQHSARLELLDGRAVDRIVYGVGESAITVYDHGEGVTRAIRAEHSGFADAVIWNPGAGHGLADLPADSWREFLCVEAAQIEQPLRLAPGEEWLGRQRLSLA
ncbi:MAG: D-hexose-6-phosphate mutarotase [Inhella sp.]